MAEWLKATDCKSVDVCLHRFESCFSHNITLLFFSSLFFLTKLKKNQKNAYASEDLKAKIPLERFELSCLSN